MGNMMCFSHSGVVEVLGALDVFPVVPGGAVVAYYLLKHPLKTPSYLTLLSLGPL